MGFSRWGVEGEGRLYLLQLGNKVLGLGGGDPTPHLPPYGCYGRYCCSPNQVVNEHKVYLTYRSSTGQRALNQRMSEGAILSLYLIPIFMLTFILEALNAWYLLHRQRDSTAISDRDITAISDRDGTAISDRDGSAISDRDGTAISDRDSSAISDRDGTAISDRDGTAISDRDSTAISLTPLHNAVLEGNLAAVKLLLQHGADVNKKDVDTWTPLHAACANGEADIARYLLSKGASKDIKTNDGERPLDLCDARDFSVISVMLESDSARKAKLQDMRDDEFLDDDVNNNSGDDADGNHSGSDGSPETPRRRTSGQADVRNPYTKSSSCSLSKAMSSLRTVLEDNVSSDLPSPDSTHSDSNPYTLRTELKSRSVPSSQSILKKSK
ncbi:hypothetical protein Btru_009533 [Bulinus truncatus]|nr:hypothetical protein Btru_009533 [Bulinus truncatus]